MDISPAKLEPTRHRRKDRTKSLAVTAGVADRITRATSFSLALRTHRDAGRQCGRLAGQRVKGCRCCPRLAAAASAPAIRPNAVPIVMPTPPT